MEKDAFNMQIISESRSSDLHRIPRVVVLGRNVPTAETLYRTEYGNIRSEESSRFNLVSLKTTDILNVFIDEEKKFSSRKFNDDIACTRGSGISFYRYMCPFTRIVKIVACRCSFTERFIRRTSRK